MKIKRTSWHFKISNLLVDFEHHNDNLCRYFWRLVGTLFLLGCMSIAIASGIGLLQGKRWGRIVGIVNAALSLLLVPIGTVIGILILIYLLKPEVREYFNGSP